MIDLWFSTEGYFNEEESMGAVDTYFGIDHRYSKTLLLLLLLFFTMHNSTDAQLVQIKIQSQDSSPGAS